MNIILVSPIGYISPGLFETLEKTFAQKGHTFTDDPKKATCCFFDSHCGFAPYDWSILNIIIERKIMVVYWDAFDYHGDSSKYWFGLNNWEDLHDLRMKHDWAKFLDMILSNGNKLIYFMRKMQTNADYGPNVYPFEYVQFPDHDFPITTKEELSSREYDICFIGARSPARWNTVNALLYYGLKVDYQFTEERIPHEDWLQRHRKAKFFLESDGGGINSERPFQLMTIAPMLKQKNLGLIKNDWIDGLECVKIGDQTGYVPPTDIEDLKIILSEPDTLYSIYLKGVEKLKTYFNPEYRANYILDTISKHL